MKKTIVLLLVSLALFSCQKPKVVTQIVESDITWTFKKGNYNGRAIPEFSINVNPLKVYSVKLVQIERGMIEEKILRGLNNFNILDINATTYPQLQDNVYYKISIHYHDGTDKSFDSFKVY